MQKLKKYKVIDMTNVQLLSLNRFMGVLGYIPLDLIYLPNLGIWKVKNTRGVGKVSSYSHRSSFENEYNLSFKTAVALHNGTYIPKIFDEVHAMKLPKWKDAFEYDLWCLPIPYASPIDILIAYNSRLIDHIKLQCTNKGDIVVQDGVVNYTNEYAELSVETYDYEPLVTDGGIIYG